MYVCGDCVCVCACACIFVGGCVSGWVHACMYVCGGRGSVKREQGQRIRTDVIPIHLLMTPGQLAEPDAGGLARGAAAHARPHERCCAHARGAHRVKRSAWRWSCHRCGLSCHRCRLSCQRYRLSCQRCGLSCHRCRMSCHWCGLHCSRHSVWTALSGLDLLAMGVFIWGGSVRAQRTG